MSPFLQSICYYSFFTAALQILTATSAFLDAFSAVGAHSFPIKLQ